MTTAELLRDLALRGIYLASAGATLQIRAAPGVVVDETLLEAIGARRDELFEMVSKPAHSSATIGGAAEGSRVRCTHGQEQFLFTAELDNSPESYRLSSAFRFDGELDAAAFGKALRATVENHDALRMRFVQDAGEIFLETSDWLPKLEVQTFRGTERELLDRILAGLKPFDLWNGPHIDFSLHRLASQRYLFFLTCHHIACDGGSIPLIADSINRHYQTLVGDFPPTCAPRASFADFARCQRLDASRGRLDSATAFWRRELAEAPALSTFPSDYPRAWHRSTEAGIVPLPLGGEDAPRLRSLAIALRTTDFQLILAAFALLLQRHTGQDNVVVGVPWRNRTNEEENAIVGPLLNVLPLHIRVADCRTISELLDEVQRRLASAIDHGRLPFSMIVEAVQPPRSAAFSPIFQLLCSAEPTNVPATILPGLIVEPIDLGDSAGRYDLALILTPSPDGLCGRLKFDRALYREDSARRLTDQLLQIVKAFATGRTAVLHRMPLVGDADAALIDRFSSGPRRPDLNSGTPLIGHFEACAGRHPQAIAIEHGARALTYRELDHAASTIAAEIGRSGARTDQIIAICMARSLEFVVAVLAVMKTGCGYLPLDPELPVARRQLMLGRSGAAAVISGIDLRTMTPALHPLGDTARISATSSSRASRRSANSASYLIYTSGSTGEPKGVLTDHRAIANNLLWMNDQWPLGEGDALLFKSSTGFDVSVKEIFWPLISGARLVVADPYVEHDPTRLEETIVRHGVTVVHLVPTMLDFFLASGSRSILSNLRIVMCGGEKLTCGLRDRFHQASPATLLHLYGPTEAAVAVTGSSIDRGDVIGGDSIPLGRPMPNCEIHVLGPMLERLPPGAPGELFIGGTPLARCYVGDAALTAERFLPHPFSREPGARLYRTGDRARWRSDGQLEFLGRMDRQLKIRGMRIEPGEIEALLRKCDGVSDAFVTCLGQGESAVLTAYVTTIGEHCDERRMRSQLLERAPRHMVPAWIVKLAAFPTNANGKVDPSQLPPPDGLVDRSPRRPPRSELELSLAAIWEEVLGVQEISLDEELFDLGGTSILLVEMRTMMRERLDLDIPMATFFQHPGLGELCRHIEELKRRGGGPWLTRILATGKG